MTRIKVSAVVFAALIGSGCLNDSPVTSSPQGRVALSVSLHSISSDQSIRARVFFVEGQTEQEQTLFLNTYRVTGGPQQVAASFDLTTCLSLFKPDAIGPYCDVELELELLENGQVVDTRLAGPMRVRPGEVAQSPTLFLVSGNTPPIVNKIDTAVAVEPGLIRYQVSGSDADSDLLLITARMFDFKSALVGVATSSFSQLLGAFSGTLYAFVPQFTQVQSMEVVMEDTKGNLSSLASRSVDYPSRAVQAEYVQTDTTSDSVYVNFVLLDQARTSDSVEVVFRNVLDVTNTTDTLYFVCGKKFTPGLDTVRVACKRHVAFDRAEAIVVPFSATEWGGGARCGVPGNCGLGGAFRRKRD